MRTEGRPVFLPPLITADTMDRVNESMLGMGNPTLSSQSPGYTWDSDYSNHCGPRVTHLVNGTDCSDLGLLSLQLGPSHTGMPPHCPLLSAMHPQAQTPALTPDFPCSGTLGFLLPA